MNVIKNSKSNKLRGHESIANSLRLITIITLINADGIAHVNRTAVMTHLVFIMCRSVNHNKKGYYILILKMI